MGKTGVLLVNLGTPDSPRVSDVRKYLREFLLDKRVIDISAIGRWVLVNLIIAPFRAPKSAKVYKQLWEDRGSPLVFYGKDVRDMLQQKLGDHYAVSLAMRYQSPSIAEGLKALQSANVEKLIVVPLFPQYASATTGSVHDKVMEIVRQWEVIPEIKMISKFLEEPLFIEAFAEKGQKHMQETDYDHFIFSYHGLPERQIKKSSVGNYCQLNGKCCARYHSRNQYCYRAQCFRTSALIAEKLGIPEAQYTVSFQSRLGSDPWIKPYTDELLKTLPGKGIKKVLAFSPSFISDCLETTIEVGEEFKGMFHEAGGEKWQLVESLNDSPKWVECLEKLVRE